MKEVELKLIDDYFQQKATDAEKTLFEEKLKTENEFAELVAFYSHTKAIEREKILNKKHAEWSKNKGGNSLNFFPKIVMGIAASLLVFLGFWYFNFNNNSSDKNLIVNNYIEQILSQLPMKMNASEDSLELGKKYFNEKKYREAFEIFNSIKTPQAFEFQGLSALKAGDYLQAEAIFEQMSKNPELLNNKGKFYLGITKMKNGQKEEAEKLFDEVISQNLGGNDIVKSWKE
jgi:tetratricopeptide (TPR) repeat protein